MGSNFSLNDQNNKKEDSDSKLKSSRGSRLWDSFFNQTTNNTRDVVAYVLLILGIILLFFHSFYGGILIGLVGGVYFSKEILYLLRNYENFIHEQGVVRSLVLGGLSLAFFISAPAIFIGVALAIALKILLTNEGDK